MTIREAAAALRGRKLSCVELTQQALQQVSRLNPKLNAFITVTEESALIRARQLDDELAQGHDRGLLHGIPIAHKDIICTRGVRTTSGSKLFADSVPDHDAAVVTKFDAAGVVMIGKTGLHELAYGITSSNPHFGPVRNPWDPERIPGGSSGGSGAAVAVDMCFIATGTDTGGSIRIPASFCGVAGLKPTYGRVSTDGVRPLGLSLDHVGPLARSVDDAAIAFEAMVELLQHPQAHKKELRIGLPENFYLDQADPQVRAAIEGTARKCETLGMRVQHVRVPDIEALNTVARVILLAEASAVFEPYLADRDKFGADVLALLDQGRLVPATGYINAQRLRKKLTAEFHRLFDAVDLLFTPATPVAAPKIGQREIEISGETQDVRLASTRLVRGINALGFPALSLPCGLTSGGLPIGLQIVARPFEDELLLDAGRSIEQALGLRLHPNL